MASASQSQIAPVPKELLRYIEYDDQDRESRQNHNSKTNSFNRDEKQVVTKKPKKESEALINRKVVPSEASNTANSHSSFPRGNSKEFDHGYSVRGQVVDLEGPMSLNSESFRAKGRHEMKSSGVTQVKQPANANVRDSPIGTIQTESDKGSEQYEGLKIISNKIENILNDFMGVVTQSRDNLNQKSQSRLHSDNSVHASNETPYGTDIETMLIDPLAKDPDNATQQKNLGNVERYGVSTGMPKPLQDNRRPVLGSINEKSRCAQKLSKPVNGKQANIMNRDYLEEERTNENLITTKSKEQFESTRSPDYYVLPNTNTMIHGESLKRHSRSTESLFRSGSLDQRNFTVKEDLTGSRPDVSSNSATATVSTAKMEQPTVNTNYSAYDYYVNVDNTISALRSDNIPHEDSNDKTLYNRISSNHLVRKDLQRKNSRIDADLLNQMNIQHSDLPNQDTTGHGKYQSFAGNNDQAEGSRVVELDMDYDSLEQKFLQKSNPQADTYLIKQESQTQDDQSAHEDLTHQPRGKGSLSNSTNSRNSENANHVDKDEFKTSKNFTPEEVAHENMYEQDYKGNKSLQGINVQNNYGNIIHDSLEREDYTTKEYILNGYSHIHPDKHKRSSLHTGLYHGQEDRQATYGEGFLTEAPFFENNSTNIRPEDDFDITVKNKPLEQMSQPGGYHMSYDGLLQTPTSRPPLGANQIIYRTPQEIRDEMTYGDRSVEFEFSFEKSYQDNLLEKSPENLQALNNIHQSQENSLHHNKDIKATPSFYASMDQYALTSSEIFYGAKKKEIEDANEVRAFTAHENNEDLNSGKPLADDKEYRSIEAPIQEGGRRLSVSISDLIASIKESLQGLEEKEKQIVSTTNQPNQGGLEKQSKQGSASSSPGALRYEGLSLNDETKADFTEVKLRYKDDFVSPFVENFLNDQVVKTEQPDPFGIQRRRNFF